MLASRQVAFISHGGGPMPLLGDPGHVQMIDYLQNLSRELIAVSDNKCNW